MVIRNKSQDVKTIIGISNIIGAKQVCAIFITIGESVIPQIEQNITVQSKVIAINIIITNKYIDILFIFCFILSIFLKFVGKECR